VTKLKYEDRSWPQACHRKVPIEGEGGLLLSTNDPFPAPPGWLERAGCIFVGVIAGSAGGYVAFERSNQLGSAVLLVIGAVFLVIGIQGTRLMRFTSGSNVVELEQKRRIIVAAEKAQEEGNPERASGIVEGAAIVNPALSAQATGLQYELQVHAALVGMGYRVAQVPWDAGYDLSIADANDRLINAELKRSSRPVRRETIERFVRMASHSLVPAILITYTELSKSAQEMIGTSENIEAVQWRGEDDNTVLEEALHRIFARSPSNGSMPSSRPH
jgi:Restriction endonuclease